MWTFGVPPLKGTRLYAGRPCSWERVECCRILTVPTPPFWAYYFELRVQLSSRRRWRKVCCQPQICYNVASAIFTGKHAVVVFSCYESLLGQGGCGFLYPPAAGVRRSVDHYSFASLVLCCAFQTALSYLAYRRAVEIVWPSVGIFPCWIPYGFANGRVYTLSGAEVPSHKQNATRVVGEDKGSPARNITWSAASANRCSMADAWFIGISLFALLLRISTSHPFLRRSSYKTRSFRSRGHLWLIVCISV